MNLLYIIIGVILLGLFLYFGYRNDYRRNPKEFWQIVLGVPLILFALLLFFFWGDVLAILLTTFVDYLKELFT